MKKKPRLCKEVFFNENHLELWCGRENGHKGRHTTSIEGDIQIRKEEREELEMKHFEKSLKKIKEPRNTKIKKPRKVKELEEIKDPVEPQDFNDQPIQPVEIKLDVSQLNEEEKQRRIQEYSDMVNRRNVN